MAISDALAQRIQQRLSRRKGVEVRKMFGGIGLLLNGNISEWMAKQRLSDRTRREQPYVLVNCLLS